jgi:hypothetical protein
MIPELSEQHYRSVAGSAGLVSWPLLFRYWDEEVLPSIVVKG